MVKTNIIDPRQSPDSSGEKEQSHCGIPLGCAREIPLWLVIVDNAPTLIMFILGSIILWQLGKFLSILYFIFCGLSILWFWGRICPYCHHHGTKACPCGYGQIAAKLFKARKNKDFRKVFKQNIVMLFPCWLIPTGAGIYLLRYHFSGPLLGLFLGFCIVGFIVIPAISKFVGCKGCEIKDQCPWMSHRSNS